MDFIRQSRRSEQAAPALPPETVLAEQWHLTGTAAATPNMISYLAVQAETGDMFHVLEYLPEDAAERAEDGSSVLADDDFAEGRKRFLKAARTLAKQNVPHLPELREVIEANGTAYCVFPQTEGETLARTDFPRTASYVRSIGIALCDTYTALHRSGLFYGRLSASEILVRADGTFTLNPDQILEAAADGTSDLTEDMHILTTFLSGMLGSIDEDAELPEDIAILRNVLQYSYQDAALLKNALICEENTLEKPQTARSSAKSVIRAVLCLLFLLAGAAGAFWLGRNHLPLGWCMKLGLVREDVISVWMPMETTLDEVETQEMYQKLTAGFEREYPGFGVNLVIYADDSFADALSLSDTEPPTVFMNCDDPAVQEIAGDLTLLTKSIPDTYLADMRGFTRSIPLGCSLTALYYNAYSCEEIEADSIEYADIAEEIGYDASAAQFLHHAEPEHARAEGDFREFLASRSEQPFLASTTRLAIAERNALTSGAIRMLPVSADGTYPLQYEMCCSINGNADWNSQRIGMLWLQYLLTEEAQQIMFAEYYSALPMHSDVLAQTIENHDALSVIGKIRDEIDSSALQ